MRLTTIGTTHLICSHERVKCRTGLVRGRGFSWFWSDVVRHRSSSALSNGNFSLK